ncbi:asparaginase [Actinoplanes sp. LDG1-06]|uniref:Asparaginase n=2 Tax=Paractinoplanes ovalisporus TaxID=2810368 RepID=A0ABS2AEY0_9ACTN|nr:asparaginase [Actinoplanes ovalisporus]
MTALPDGGVAPALSADQLVAAVPALASVPLEARSLRAVAGSGLTVDDLLAVRETLVSSFADGVRGAVITQGTDSIEETAYVLDLLHDSEHPIVVTGAMRNPTLPGADGPANLLAAVRVAHADSSRGLGCLVVMADEIHAAARVRKSHTMSTAAFTSPDGGPLGHVAEGRVRFTHFPVRRQRVPVPRGALARVGLYTATLGDDGSLLPAYASSVDGLVVAGFGVGHVPEPWVGHLSVIAERIPVVLASRTGAGWVGVSTYGFPGSERDLVARGLIPAGDLHPYKARVLLQLLLSSGQDVRAGFA